MLFTSPSSAAEFVTGKSCNGWVSWKTKDGKTLHDLEEQELVKDYKAYGLYAKIEKEVFPDGEPFVIGGNSIGARTLDLNQEFSEITSQLDYIAKDYFV